MHAAENDTAPSYAVAWGEGCRAAQGIGLDTLRAQYRAQISWGRWIRGRYGSRLRIGEDQIKAMQERIAAAASKPQYQISEVFLDANRVGGMEVAVNGAGQLIAQMQQGAPFQAVARQFSASATAAGGGEVGWVSMGEMAPEVDAALAQMRPGQLSQPIPVRDGVPDRAMVGALPALAVPGDRAVIEYGDLQAHAAATAIADIQVRCAFIVCAPISADGIPRLAHGFPLTIRKVPVAALTGHRTVVQNAAKRCSVADLPRRRAAQGACDSAATAVGAGGGEAQVRNMC